ncbi:MAG: CoA-binding protein, partial [Alphaproteobacteria bacterium]|nr:CoA-binding protein [Alphaproteobacteria bacterium]
MLRDLRPLLQPRSVAVIGASDDIARPGGRAMQYLERYGFSGGIYPINPGRREVMGRPCVPNVAALAEAPDMAVIAVPAVGVVDV